MLTGLAAAVFLVLSWQLLGVALRSKNHTVIFYAGLGGLFSAVLGAFLIFREVISYF